MSTLGIHHISSIASEPQRTLDFWGGTLGLRFVKRTVNFDAPSAYHLYLGDEFGRPGTIVSFFPLPNARRGRQGTGQAAVISLAIPPTSIGWWIERLLTRQVAYTGPERRFDEQVLAFHDPDGLLVEIVGSAGAANRPGWDRGAVPAGHAVRGVHAVTLWADGREPTERVLTDLLGFRRAAESDHVARFTVGDGEGPGAIVDVRVAPDFWRGAMGAGVVHHVAFRVADEAAQLALRERVAHAGLGPTEQLDRRYFRSVYFREPGGVLFELATDGPGFAADDEPIERFGESLQLPPWLEGTRASIESGLPTLRAPASGPAAPATLAELEERRA